MAWTNLYDYQREAINHLHTGSILCGGVGSGKSRTSLAYYYKVCGGDIDANEKSKMTHPLNLYIITTARKRDTGEWAEELAVFGLEIGDSVIVDSWNNIKHFSNIKNSFFIFDEQRVVGKGAWVTAFLKIAENNQWILLSATPGDTWQDYIPVFLANGFYKSRTEFNRDHVVFSRYTKYPKVERYTNVGRLVRLRNSILVEMKFNRTTQPHHVYVNCEYDKAMYKAAGKTRWDPFRDEAIENASGLCYVWRRIVNGDDSRSRAILQLTKEHRKVIIFYNFDYERDILLSLKYQRETRVAEWSGHAHEPIPREALRWVYIVQYTAGCEGWNCVDTDTIIFYSQNYSYKVMAQATGRIDRLNTNYKDLYYYHLVSKSNIDLAIAQALKEKRTFNEGKFVKW